MRKQLESINPSNYQVLGAVDVSTADEIEAAIAAARAAQAQWAGLEIRDRVAHLQVALDDLRMKKDEYCVLQSREMGMPLTESLADLGASLVYASWYLENAERLLAPETTLEDEHELHQVFHEPYGVHAVIAPWNFPLANLVWGCFQSLLAGNTVVFKHSEECSLSGRFLAQILTKHLPDGVFTELYGAGDVGRSLAEQAIDLLTFTGSTKIGRELYRLGAQKFIKVLLELGGSAPGIVFDDADLETTIETICCARLMNQGQCCDGLKRLLVHESILNAVVGQIGSVFAAKKIGVAEASATELGPLVAKRQLDLLTSQVDDATAKGATVVTGGHSLEEKLGGAFFEPTILTNVTQTMRVWTEEVFGPVLPIVPFKTEAEAIALANDTTYGLGAYVFTRDQERAARVARAIRSGMVSVNGVTYVRPFNPFGGFKHSGLGREHGRYGFEEVTQLKIVARTK